MISIKGVLLKIVEFGHFIYGAAMYRKIYYLFFIVFILVWGVWYTVNYEEIMKEHSEQVSAENVDQSIEVYDDEYVPYLININKADVYELTALEGIGEKKAQNIVEYREEHGLFSSKEELLEVSGIGEAILSNIEDKITLEE